MAKFVRHTSCPACGSSDANAIYDDDSTYCYSCGVNTQPHKDQEDMTGRIDPKDIPRLPSEGLALRGINRDVSQRYGVRVEYNQDTGQEQNYYFPVYKDGKLLSYQRKPAVEQGQRSSAESPRYVSSAKGHEPFGSQVVAGGGKFILVTEGAEDCLATVQMLKESGKNYRVVALLGTEMWKKNIDWFSRWDKVAICFDQDKAGQAAAADFCSALRPGQAVIVKWTKHKDPNALLVNGLGKEFYSYLSDAKPFRPEGLITGDKAWEIIKGYREPEYIHYPPEFPELQEMTGGIRRGEISLWTSGTGCGKSLFIRRIKQHIIQNTNWTVGDVELEETKEKTIRAMLQFQQKKPMIYMSDDEKWAAHQATYGTGRIITLDHRSQYGRGQSLSGKMKFLHYGMGADIMFIDHISLAQNEFGDSGEGLVQQDRLMSELLEIAEKTGMHICIISHLRKTPSGGRAFEAGGIPSLDDIRGSGSIKQISFDVIALGRNNQHEDEYERNTTQIALLKCRETGNTGPADRLYWDKSAYEFQPHVEQEEREGEPEF